MSSREDLPSWAQIDGDGALVSLVFDDGGLPEGHSLEPLPADYWEIPYRREGAAFVVDWDGFHEDLHRLIDEGAGAFRSRFITVVPGQEMTYLAKEAQARAFLEGRDPEASPMIVGEAKARGLDPERMAAFVIARADEWHELGALIEIRRIEAKEAVLAASTAAEKRAASVVNWETLLIGKGSSRGGAEGEEDLMSSRPDGS